MESYYKVVAAALVMYQTIVSVCVCVLLFMKGLGFMDEALDFIHTH